MSQEQPEHISEQLAFETEGMPAQEPLFNPEQRRAFGSVPTLLGKNMEIPAFHRLDANALARVEPAIIKRGLLGQEGRHAVDGIVLSPEEYEVVVRNPRSFQASIQAKTIAANKNLQNEARAKEKEIKSPKHAFEQKTDRHETVLASLTSERDMLTELLEWQKVPGYARTSQIDIVSLAGQAWNMTFRGMLHTLKDQHELTADQHIDLVNAMAYKLFRGPQNERMSYWGDMLRVARSYNQAKISLFNNRHRKITRYGGRLASQLDQHHDQHGIS